jgi:hypothetical protein
MVILLSGIQCHTERRAVRIAQPVRMSMARLMFTFRFVVFVRDAVQKKMIHVMPNQSPEPTRLALSGCPTSRGFATVAVPAWLSFFR